MIILVHVLYYGFVAMVTFAIHVDYHYCVEKFPKVKDKDMITDKNEEEKEEKGNDENVVEREREEGGRKNKEKGDIYIVFNFNNLRATCTYCYIHYSYRYMAYQMHWLYRIHIADHSPLHHITSICALLCVLYCYQLHWIKSSCTH